MGDTFFHPTKFFIKTLIIEIQVPNGEGSYNVLESEITGLGFVPLNPYQNFSYTVAGGEIYSATFVDKWSEQPIIYRDPVRTVHEFAPALNGPQFIHSFTHDGYAYFLFNEWSMLSPDYGKKAPLRVVEARIGRVCIGDTGYLDLIYDKPLIWKTFLKVKMVCKVPNGDNEEDRINGASKSTPHHYSDYADTFRARYNPNPSLSFDPRDRRDITATIFDSLVASTSPQNIKLDTESNPDRFYSVFTAPSPLGTIPISVLCRFDTDEIAKIFKTGIDTMDERMIRSGVKRVPRGSTGKPGECGYDLVDPGEAEYLQKFALLHGNDENKGLGNILEIEGKPLNVWSGRRPSAITAVYNYEKREGVETDQVYLGTSEGEVYRISISTQPRSNAPHQYKSDSVDTMMKGKSSAKIISIMVNERLIVSNKRAIITGLYTLAKAKRLLVAIATGNGRSTSILASLAGNQCGRPYGNFSCHGLEDYNNNVWSNEEMERDEQFNDNEMEGTNQEPSKYTPSSSAHYINTYRDSKIKPQGARDLNYNDPSHPSKFPQTSHNYNNDDNRIDDSPRFYQSRGNPAHCPQQPISNSQGNMAERLSLAITFSVCIASLLGCWIGFKLKTRLDRLRKDRHLDLGSGGCRDLMAINMSSIRNMNKDSGKDCVNDKLESGGVDKGQRFLSSFSPFVDYRVGANKQPLDDTNLNHSNNNGNNFFSFFLPTTPINNALNSHPLEQSDLDQASPLNAVVVPPYFANFPNNLNNLNPFANLTLLKHSNGQQYLCNAYGPPINLQHQPPLSEQPSPSIYEPPPQPPLPRLPPPVYNVNNCPVTGTDNTIRRVYYFQQPNHYDINDNANNSQLPAIINQNNIPHFNEFKEFHPKENINTSISDGTGSYDENCLNRNNKGDYIGRKPLPPPRPN
ncbi:unnamed protein product [Gordionus sp. m RMFG-2023]